MNKFTKFDDVETILLHVISESDVNPLDINNPTNSSNGKYLLLKKRKKKTSSEDDEYDVISDSDIDMSESEAAEKTKDEMQNHKNRHSKYIFDASEKIIDIRECLNIPTSEIENIKYSQPIKMGLGENEHTVYQRIILKNTGSEKTVYDAVKKQLERSGIEFDVVDAVFEGTRVKYITNIDGKKENMTNSGVVKYNDSDMNGERNASWEVIVDGEFLQGAIDKSKIKKGSLIELRRKSGCGGGGVNYDLAVIENDPSIDKRMLPNFIQSYISIKNSYKSTAFSLGTV
ncbi:MAG: hypothetical protein KAS04_02135 [Candidatus Aenigmarchaeota archaeon]|nr:hypothetical protein [Candidatus Aenigmarchaeota archaeon]